MGQIHVEKVAEDAEVRVSDPAESDFAGGPASSSHRFLQAFFKPPFAVGRTFAFTEQERAPDTPRHAVTPADCRHIHELEPSHRHGESPVGTAILCTRSVDKTQLSASTAPSRLT
jgi:hypothetical protein